MHALTELAETLKLIDAALAAEIETAITDALRDATIADGSEPLHTL